MERFDSKNIKLIIYIYILEMANDWQRFCQWIMFGTKLNNDLKPFTQQNAMIIKCAWWVLTQGGPGIPGCLYHQHHLHLLQISNKNWLTRSHWKKNALSKWLIFSYMHEFIFGTLWQTVAVYSSAVLQTASKGHLTLL